MALGATEALVEVSCILSIFSSFAIKQKMFFGINQIVLKVIYFHFLVHRGIPQVPNSFYASEYMYTCITFLKGV
jgi:hypothetical protein